MTTPRDPDALASALLDGLLAADEAAAVRRDPAVVARLAELAAVREAVGTPPPPPSPVARERSLAAALAAFDEAGEAHESDEASEPGTTSVAPMPPARAARHGSRRTDTAWRAPDQGRRGRWLTAAAVMLAVVGLGFLARDWGSDGDDAEDTAATASADDSSNEGGGSGDDARETEAGDAAGGEEGADTGDQAHPALELIDLGDVGSPEALADRARSAVADRSADADLNASDGGGDLFTAACRDGSVPGVPAPAAGTVVLQARATLDGQPVDVMVLDADGAQRLVAVDADCTLVVDQPLGD